MAARILIVDDEPMNLDLLEQELLDQGHHIERAADGPETLRRIESFVPDLILLDYQMPQMNGLDVLREIRNRGERIPVIMITANGTIELAVRAMKE
ncbi:MAG: response regulator, partial [Deltaproteobacteria bacterium]|nr:response regulator [Deltaproteobacteria bacterium]